jgi:hypothetical protein
MIGRSNRSEKGMWEISYKEDKEKGGNDKKGKSIPGTGRRGP